MSSAYVAAWEIIALCLSVTHPSDGWLNVQLWVLMVSSLSSACGRAVRRPRRAL